MRIQSEERWKLQQTRLTRPQALSDDGKIFLARVSGRRLNLSRNFGRRLYVPSGSCYDMHGRSSNRLPMGESVPLIVRQRKEDREAIIPNGQSF